MRKIVYKINLTENEIWLILQSLMREVGENNIKYIPIANKFDMLYRGERK